MTDKELDIREELLVSYIGREILCKEEYKEEDEYYDYDDVLLRGNFYRLIKYDFSVLRINILNNESNYDTLYGYIHLLDIDKGFRNVLTYKEFLKHFELATQVEVRQRKIKSILD